MNFCELQYLKKGEKPWVKDYVLKLPIKLRKKYLLVFAPLKKETIKIGNEEGIKITLPIEENEENALKERLIKKALSFLLENHIKAIINPCNMEIDGFFVATGSIVKSLCIMEVINKLNCKNKKVTVIDGDNLETYIVLNKLMGNINNLYICTDNKEKFANIETEFFEETGLVTEFFQNPKSEEIKESEVVINCRQKIGNWEYAFKRNSLYIDVMNLNVNSIKMKRKDVKAVGDVYININGVILNSVYGEIYFFIKEHNIISMFLGNENISSNTKKIKSLQGVNLNLEDIKR